MILEKHPVLAKAWLKRSDGGRSLEGMPAAPEMIRLAPNQHKQRLRGAKVWQLVRIGHRLGLEDCCQTKSGKATSGLRGRLTDSVITRG